MRRAGRARRDMPHAPALGISLMATAMLVIPGADAIGKYLSDSHSPLFLSWARYAAALVFVLPAAVVLHARNGGLAIARRELPSHALRTIFLIASVATYYVAIARIPLADALGAYFVAPIAATLLAAIVLREPLDRRRLAAVVLGFIGAALVVRADAAANAGTLIALASGCLMACYFVTTRAAVQASAPLPTLVLQFTLGTLLLTPLALLDWTTPGAEALALILLSGVLSAASNLLTITAFRLAPVSTLSPLVYLELVGATLLGIAVFGDVPSSVTWVGIAVIVASGLSLARQPKPRDIAAGQRT